MKELKEAKDKLEKLLDVNIRIGHDGTKLVLRFNEYHVFTARKENMIGYLFDLLSLSEKVSDLINEINVSPENNYKLKHFSDKRFIMTNGKDNLLNNSVYDIESWYLIMVGKVIL